MFKIKLFLHMAQTCFTTAALDTASCCNRSYSGGSAGDSTVNYDRPSNSIDCHKLGSQVDRR